MRNLNARRAGALVALLAATHVHAEVIGYVDLPGAARIELHDDQGICLGAARRAVYVPLRPGDSPVSGCWASGGQVVSVVFLNAAAVDFPVQLVRQPKKV